MAHAIQQAIQAWILPSVSDPVVSQLEVAMVDVSADLASVTVHFVPGQGGTPVSDPEVRVALRRAEPHFRREIAESVDLKRAPMVHLRYLPMAR